MGEFKNTGPFVARPLGIDAPMERMVRVLQKHEVRQSAFEARRYVIMGENANGGPNPLGVVSEA
jgi:hypothetical protein